MTAIYIKIHTFEYQEITNDTNAASYGPAMDKETLILNNCNLAQFNIVKDNDKSYIIASSHGKIYVFNSINWLPGIDREKVDLLVPKSDAEVAAIYPIIEQLNCKIFLPNL